MSRKADSQITKKHLLKAAFKNFYEVGFENTSLDKISKDAKLSRGAAYWHFANKSELFSHLIELILEEVYEEKQQIIQDERLSFQEKVVRIIFVSYQDSSNFKFLQRSIQTIEQHPEFTVLLEKIKDSKAKLYYFFLDGLVEQQVPLAEANALASLFYSYFEGMYASGTPQEVVENYTLEIIEKNIFSIFKTIE
ncbi:hypothetical protein NRIC_34490 [Enterococcus florum]|uniref:HTH tetR-type domain-containing protein n=1 Tax=Enterococcus florum TaxID=2480627 RepID=A0A4P5PGW6_9ENTE|nr:TetR/AcrR family transcriptional regulator [Enterococcus florum]GCF95558.1 hypothetical protein NRIC_34490 [Enterococcus florum]